MEKARCQNPVTYGSGYAAALAAQTAAIKGLLKYGEGAEIAEPAETLEGVETAETVIVQEGMIAEGGTRTVNALDDGASDYEECHACAMKNVKLFEDYRAFFKDKITETLAF